LPRPPGRRKRRPCNRSGTLPQLIVMTRDGESVALPSAATQIFSYKLISVLTT